MSEVQSLEARREAILAEMRSIRSMRRGTINEQYMRVKHKGKREPALRGPYYIFSRWEGKKTIGYRLTTPEELEEARRDVAAHKHFIEICREYEHVTEQLGAMERGRKEQGDMEKKRRRLRSSKTPK